MTLTEQWKAGELEDGFYYTQTGKDKIIAIDMYDKESDSWLLNSDKDMPPFEVLAPVTSYEECLESESHCAVYSEVNKSLKEENQRLKTQIAKLTEIVGVLPSNHSVGNLGYRIKNQRHEINNRLKEIDKLKKLLHSLKCCLTSENIEPQIRVEKSLAKIEEFLTDGK